MTLSSLLLLICLLLSVSPLSFTDDLLLFHVFGTFHVKRTQSSTMSPPLIQFECLPSTSRCFSSPRFFFRSPFSLLSYFLPERAIYTRPFCPGHLFLFDYDAMIWPASPCNLRPPLNLVYPAFSPLPFPNFSPFFYLCFYLPFSSSRAHSAGYPSQFLLELFFFSPPPLDHVHTFFFD